MTDRALGPPAGDKLFSCGGPEGITAARLDADADVDVVCAANPAGKVFLYENVATFTESDGDGVRNDLDCAPGDATVFAVPGEVRNVRSPIGTELRWDPEGPRAGTSTGYDVMRGSLAELPVGSGSAGTCLADGTLDTKLVEGSDPAVGEGFYYLVRGSNACGVGSYGHGSSGAERMSTICP